MKNELVNQFETEMWIEIGASFITRKWADYTICKTKRPFAPLRVLVAISTHAGVTTRPKIKQARQHQLASLSFLTCGLPDCVPETSPCRRLHSRHSWILRQEHVGSMCLTTGDEKTRTPNEVRWMLRFHCETEIMD